MNVETVVEVVCRAAIAAASSSLAERLRSVRGLRKAWSVNRTKWHTEADRCAAFATLLAVSPTGDKRAAVLYARRALAAAEQPAEPELERLYVDAFPERKAQ